MDAVAAVATSKKAIDVLKWVPVWLLASVAVVATLFLVVPTLQPSLPDSVKLWLLPAVITAWALMVFKGASDLGGAVLARRRAVAERDRTRLTELYRPLSSLFLTRHVTIVGNCKAPRLRDRIENAQIALTKYQRRRVGLKRALRALFDRRTSRSAEIEYGGTFPQTQILKITRTNQQYADSKLLNLVCAADRSRYEEPGDPSLVTDAELALFEHIEAEHERLSRKLS
jgi:hypothetical protein